jgi:hypothetical protein
MTESILIVRNLQPNYERFSHLLGASRYVARMDFCCYSQFDFSIDSERNIRRYLVERVALDSYATIIFFAFPMVPTYWNLDSVDATFASSEFNAYLTDALQLNSRNVLNYNLTSPQSNIDYPQGQATLIVHRAGLDKKYFRRPYEVSVQSNWRMVGLFITKHRYFSSRPAGAEQDQKIVTELVIPLQRYIERYDIDWICAEVAVIQGNLFCMDLSSCPSALFSTGVIDRIIVDCIRPLRGERQWKTC